jgi:hypothetical protein
MYILLGQYASGVLVGIVICGFFSGTIISIKIHKILQWLGRIQNHE